MEKINKKIELAELKQIQMKILDNVVEFCDNENIRYFLMYGTLIGAIRHNGFIPWDDDIDIAMPREDYDRFVQTFNNSNTRYKVVDYEIDSNYLYSFAKVMDTKTVFFEKCHISYDLGVNIDIFPLDKVDEDGKLLRKTRLLRKIIFLKTMSWDNRRGCLKNIFLTIGRIIFSIIPLRILIKHVIRMGKSLKDEEIYKLSIPVEGDPNAGVWEEEWFRDFVYHTFEGKLYKIPIGYDELLKSIYGDYMQIPSDENKVSKHVFEVYWR